MKSKNQIYTDTHSLPMQTLLKGEYLKVMRLHKDLDELSSRPHRHDHYELMLVLEGNGQHAINFESYDIGSNSLFFINKGQAHQITDFDREGWLLLFDDEILNRFLQIHPQQNETGLLNSFSKKPFIELDANLKELFLSIVKQLQTELKEKKQDANIMMHYVALFLLHANKTHTEQHPQKQLNPVNKQEFLGVKKLIDRCYKEEHLGVFYTEALQMDIKKMNKICKQFTGMTLFGILQEKLLVESKIQLQTSLKTIKEISYDLGFNDPAFFGKFFKKHTGVTPLTFRNYR